MIPLTVQPNLKKIMRFNLFIFIFLYHLCYGQNQTNFWYFAEYAALDFNSGNPVALTNSALNTVEGCATISDESGNLLFYTDGWLVFNKNHNLMDNGFNLDGGQSSAQSCIIVPKPGSNTLYYIFQAGDWGAGYLTYSIVDMSYNGGLGKVINKNIMLFNNFVEEKLTGICHANGKDIWVIAKQAGTHNHLAYLVSSNGVSNMPVVSNINSSFIVGYNTSYMKLSPDGNKIAVLSEGIMLLDFDKSTGLMSNLIEIPSQQSIYAIEFSPNSQFMYYVDQSARSVIQYDISSNNLATILASKDSVFIDNSVFGWQGLQLAPNGKIYLSEFQSDYLHVINFPNNQGNNCNVVKDAVYLNGKKAGYGLPNSLVSFCNNKDIVINGNCAYDTIHFTCIGFEQADSIRWNFGDNLTSSDTSSLIDSWYFYTDTGKHYITLYYWVNNQIDSLIDSVIVRGHFPQLNLNKTICNNQPIVLDAVYYPNTNYKWFNGSNNATLIVNNIDSVWVERTQNGCLKIDSGVILQNFIFFDLGIDTSLCLGNSITLSTSIKNANYFWSNGSIESSIEVTSSGKYSLSIDSNGCVSKDSITIMFDDCTVYVPSCFSPNSDGINDVLKIFISDYIDEMELLIFNRWGELVFKSSQNQLIWDGTYLNKAVNEDIYPYRLSYKVKGDIKTIYKNGHITVIK